MPSYGPEQADAVAARVLAAVEDELVPVANRGVRMRRWVRTHLRALVALLCAVFMGLALTPPVRAAVADVFGFGGVEVRVTAPPDGSASSSGETASGAPPGGRGPQCDASMTPGAAADRAGFGPAALPAELGRPAGASVSADRRVVTVCWRRDGGAVVRLDAFRAGLDPTMGKISRARPEWVTVRGGTGLWFPAAHRLEVMLRDPHGDPYKRTVRTAGPTLLWEHDGTTLRLEGIADKRTALRVAASAR
ncbi:hypothetical protein G5C51_32675 [Streptomyces sp. A7024]|uniref:Uncharacterized protein n=1 Tax=Streptomyces coryli TaxID=1128680 RepID=A0A6G4U9E8_9ACTN|nr:hypothetical protein [Streptomyces coryli]